MQTGVAVAQWSEFQEVNVEDQAFALIRQRYRPLCAVIVEAFRRSLEHQCRRLGRRPFPMDETGRQ
jgi:hypothetical protein